MFPSGVFAKANSKQAKILCGSPKQAQVLGDIAMHAARFARESQELRRKFGKFN